MKHPIIVGVVNAIIPGVGYLIIRERVVFGTFLLAGALCLLALTLVEPSFRPTTFFVSSSILGQALESLWYVFFVLAYAYDAYSLAKDQEQTTLIAAPLPDTSGEAPSA